MASDLPDARWDSSLRMARALVRIMPSDEAVQRRIREDFDNPPALRTIRLLRIEVGLARLPTYDPHPFKAHEGYYPTDEADKHARLNRRFVERLRAAHPERFAA